MDVPPPDAPDLVGVITAANEVGLSCVIIGGFAVIANQYVRGTEDVDLLIAGDRSQDATVARFFEQIEARRGGAPIPDRAILTGILFVLRAGIPWQMLPRQMGEQRMAANLVALVGREGQAVGKEQHLHGRTG